MTTTTDRPICVGCEKYPDEIDEYVEAAHVDNEIPGPNNCVLCERKAGEQHTDDCPDYMNPDRYVEAEEGTFNQINKHFLCTSCYILAGMPSAPGGWVAP